MMSQELAVDLCLESVADCSIRLVAVVAGALPKKIRQQKINKFYFYFLFSNVRSNFCDLMVFDVSRYDNCYLTSSTISVFSVVSGVSVASLVSVTGSAQLY